MTKIDRYGKVVEIFWCPILIYDLFVDLIAIKKNVITNREDDDVNNQKIIL
jgi:hypothetical protein